MMKKYKQIIILCIILLLSLNVLNIHGDNKSDIKWYQAKRHEDGNY